MSFESNPFSTKFWTPGAIPFRFSAEDWSTRTDGEQLVAAFERYGGGQIVGPHGSGKTTLIESLKRVFQQNGYDVRHAMLNDRNRRLPDNFATEPLREPFVRIIDGFEQFTFWKRLLFQRRFPGRFLIATHRPVGRLPVLYRTAPRLDVFTELVRHLAGKEPFADDELRRLFETARGNFRDAFLTLYDREGRRDEP